MNQTFAFQSKTQTTITTFTNTEGMTNEQLLDYMNKKYKAHYTTIVNMKGKHLCKYCHEIVNGTDKDVLCKHCQETFGHSLYSQL